MTEKRFTFADGFKIVAIRDNGKIMNSRQVCNQLNEFCEENKELKEENQHIKNTIKEMLDNERTEIGKSVLKQLWEIIQ